MKKNFLKVLLPTIAILALGISACSSNNCLVCSGATVISDTTVCDDGLTTEQWNAVVALQTLAFETDSGNCVLE